MESLPIEIFSEILARLRVKDVTRIKLVNKTWYALISSHQFMNLHVKYHNSLDHDNDNDDCILVYVKIDGCLYYDQVVDTSTWVCTRKINLIDYLGYKFVDVVGSCNGLILCTCHVKNFGGINLVLVNPSTLQHKLVPKPQFAYYNLPCFGFGYDFDSNDYKIVWMERRISRHNVKFYRVFVYNLNSDFWRTIDDKDELCDGEFLDRFGVLVNNKLHWVFYGTNYGRVIKSFDVCTEQWSDVPLPHNITSFRWKVDLKCFDGRLCLLAYGMVFLMDEYGVQDSWVNL